MGMPVVVVASGGLPVTVATNGYGVPVTVATNGFGRAVTQAAGGGGLAVIGVSFGADVTAPTITSSASVSNVENAVLAHALTANETVTWSIVGGADAARFELSGSTLRWLSNGVKDFEAPNDADTNNVYVVTIRATDTASNTTNQTISVTVTDVSDSLGAGYDIFVACGDSNKMYGTAFSAGTDISAATIFALGLASPIPDEAFAAVVVLGPSANDPIDYGGENAPAKIGHDVHFIKDYYIANSLLPAGRNALIVPYARGGSCSAIDNSFNSGAFTGPAGNPTTSGASMLDYLAARITTAMALAGTNRIAAVLDTEGLNVYIGFGNTFTATLANYAWQYHRKIQYIRNRVGATTPIIIARQSSWGIDAGSVRYSTNGLTCDDIIRSMAGKFPYLGVADTLVPSALGTASDVHFTAADQRAMAGRYYTAYQAALLNTGRTCTWDPYHYPKAGRGWPANAGFTLSNGNLDLSGDANTGWKTALATAPLRSGKAYCEVKIQAMANGTDLGFLGFANADARLMNYIGLAGSAGSDAGPGQMSAGQWGGLGGGYQDVVGYTKVWTGNAVWVLNDIVMLAVDMTSGKAWMGKNGTWYNSGDPAAGTNPWFSGIIDPIYIAASISTGTGNTFRLAPTAASFTHTPPSGFSAWGV